jgi:predicted amidohydrolase YtcJ
MSSPPELIYTHAALPLAEPPASCVAVARGRIAAVGRAEDVLPLAGPGTRVVSLNGAALLPGFHDAHCHVLGFGLSLAMVSLADARTIPDLVRALQARADARDADAETWIRGRGYSQNVLAERRHPTRRDLDAVAGGQPCVLITHASGHAACVNSRALHLAGITRATPDPPGGTIVRDESGEPTGVLLETAVDLASRVAPEPSQAEKVAALGDAGRALNAMGITSAVDATRGVSAWDSTAEIPAYHEAAASGALSVRCSLMMTLAYLASLDTVPAPDSLTTETDFVRIGPAKIFTDGALTTRTAFLRSPFAQSDSLGTAVWTADELNHRVARVHAAGWQIAAHAIGDAAIDLCLDAYGKAQAKHPRADARHRIEHAMLLWPDQVGRLARLGILPVYQPEFILRLGDAYLSGLGDARASRLMPYAETQAADLPLVFSSDLPVIPGHPLDGILAAILRQAPSGRILDKRQCVSVADALRAYTAGAAYSVFLEGDRGGIAPGQRADFAVLNGDPLTLPPDEWAERLSVRATVVGGSMVYGDL